MWNLRRYQTNKRKHNERLGMERKFNLWWNKNVAFRQKHSLESQDCPYTIFSNRKSINIVNMNIVGHYHWCACVCVVCVHGKVRVWIIFCCTHTYELQMRTNNFKCINDIAILIQIESKYLNPLCIRYFVVIGVLFSYLPQIQTMLKHFQRIEDATNNDIQIKGLPLFFMWNQDE